MVPTPTTVNILGTDYTIVRVKWEKDERFEKDKIDGYCDNVVKKIVYCDMRTKPNFGDMSDVYYKKLEDEIVRHEIIHAYFKESGLDCSASHIEGPWALNEEMVDWFAIQSPKILATFQKLNIV